MSDFYMIITEAVFKIPRFHCKSEDYADCGGHHHKEPLAPHSSLRACLAEVSARKGIILGLSWKRFDLSLLSPPSFFFPCLSLLRIFCFSSENGRLNCVHFLPNWPLSCCLRYLCRNKSFLRTAIEYQTT